ncbi:MAG: response regulator [Bacilli bacterium]|nr:response regulator [Bacilli bacterium]
MTSFIVVEDDKKTQETIKDVLRRVIISRDNTINIKYFTKYTSELKRIIDDNSTRKVYIMDIELETKTSGIEIAKMIREKDWESEIIFITSHDKMFETVYRSVYQVFNFIEKFYNMEQRLEKDIELIFQKNFDNKMLSISNRNVDLQIFYRAITHITRDKEERKVLVHTDTNVFKLNMNLNDIVKLLDERFIQVHRSCIANHQRVHEWNWTKNYFLLDNGGKVEYLSKKYKKEVEKICQTS